MPSAARLLPERMFETREVCVVVLLDEWRPFGPSDEGLCACGCEEDNLSSSGGIFRSSERFRSAEFIAERKPRSFSTGAVRTGTSMGSVGVLIGPGFGFSRASGAVVGCSGNTSSSSRKLDFRFRKLPNLCCVLLFCNE
jgi:hypothetical protein